MLKRLPISLTQSGHEAGSPTQSNLIVDLADTSLERAPPIFRERHLSEAKRGC
jgi:hypothetical protein